MAGAEISPRLRIGNLSLTRCRTRLPNEYGTFDEITHSPGASCKRSGWVADSSAAQGHRLRISIGDGVKDDFLMRVSAIEADSRHARDFGGSHAANAIRGGADIGRKSPPAMEGEGPDSYHRRSPPPLPGRSRRGIIVAEGRFFTEPTSPHAHACSPAAHPDLPDRRPDSLGAGTV